MIALAAFGDKCVVASSQSPPELLCVVFVHFKLSHKNPNSMGIWALVPYSFGGVNSGWAEKVW